MALGHAHLASGDARAAIKALKETVDALKSATVKVGYTRSLAHLGEAFLLDGDVDRAESAATRSLELARADGSAFVAGIAERVLGRIAGTRAEHSKAERLLRGALETFLSCEATFEAAMTRLDLARTLASRAESAEAQAHLVEAIQVFEAAGAPQRVAQARELAHSLGISLTVP